MQNANLQGPDPLEVWSAWHVNWSAVWVGALAALAASLVFGLIATALGTVALKTFTSWQAVHFGDAVAAVCVAFFAFVAGGWASAKISGLRHGEPAILHAAITWLVATPLLVVLVALGAGGAFDAWYGGIVAAPMFAPAPTVPVPPEVVRGTALAALTSVLVGLMGAVIGGWIGSGEPMSFGHHRTRKTRWIVTEREVL